MLSACYDSILRIIFLSNNQLRRVLFSISKKKLPAYPCFEILQCLIQITKRSQREESFLWTLVRTHRVGLSIPRKNYPIFYRVWTGVRSRAFPSFFSKLCCVRKLGLPTFGKSSITRGCWKIDFLTKAYV